MAVILAIAAGIAAMLSWSAGDEVMTFPSDRGPALPSPNLWFEAGSAASFGINALILLISCGTMIFINGRYNILRGFSVSFAGLFLLMTAATPGIATVFQGGSLLALAALLGTLLFFTIYNAPKRGSKRVFLTFFLITAGALTQYGFLILLPVFLIGMGQMRVLRFRDLVAAGIGVIAPLWLWWAFSPGFPSLHAPEFDNPFAPLTLIERIRFLATVGVTLLTGFLLGGYNMVKVYSYNAKARALNGLLAVTGVATGIAAIANWSNMAFYVTLLNVCVAFQAGHFLNLNINNRTGYISTLVLVVLYGGLWLWNLTA